LRRGAGGGDEDRLAMKPVATDVLRLRTVGVYFVLSTYIIVVFDYVFVQSGCCAAEIQ